ncbi:hypothetical protein, partial [Saccharomonospora iraqiensis]|uniref:hypothetical protein n=1 Tax=Saccharomonospora iraqiensis TaxID=52698 RepID=UPI0018DE8B21
MTQTIGMPPLTPGGVRWDEAGEGGQAMSWKDFYRRREIMDAAVELGNHDAHGRIPFDRIDGARDLFGSEENLLLALHQRWTQALSGYLRARVAGPEDADNVPAGGERDHVDAVSRAWRAAVRRNAALHAVLEANVDRSVALRRAHEA